MALDLAFLLGMSFFLGFAFEDVFERAGMRRPGGVRTFPMLALIGGVLYLLDSAHLVAFTSGLLIVGAWLLVYYREHLRERDEAGQQNVGMMVLLLNVYAYLLGGIAFALPHWMAVGATVAAVLLFTGRERLHELVRHVEIKEIVTAAQFLILSGLILPLLPNQPVTLLTSITPRQAWLAVVAVCALSYASYLVQRFIAPTAGGLWMAALGGLYSSTATTVVLARQSKLQPSAAWQDQAGITLATGIMYLRVLIIVAVFNLTLARSMSVPLVALFLSAALLAAAQYRFGRRTPEKEPRIAANRNPLEIGPAVAFALTFIAVSLLSGWVRGHFGAGGLYVFAAAVGVADIDPFVLNLAQGGAAGLSAGVVAATILIAASSNNLLKAVYAASFAGWRASIPSVVALVLLAVAGLGIALTVRGSP